MAPPHGAGPSRAGRVALVWRFAWEGCTDAGRRVVGKGGEPRMGRFSGRNAIVTGASRGIGASIAERLAAEGANVLITARTVDRHERLAGSLNETLGRCRRHGATVEAFAADLADADSRARIVPHALELFGGKVDVLVNNAAAAMYHTMVGYPLHRRRVMFEINVQAPMDLAEGVIPGMAERGEGWILNVSSATAKLAPAPRSAPPAWPPKSGCTGPRKRR